MTQEAILKALSTVQEPDLGKDLVTLNMVRDVTINGDAVSFTVVLTTPACPLKDLIKRDCMNAIKKHVAEGANVTVNFTSSTTTIRADKSNVLPGVKNIIAVVSGKGGVGKSTVAANLALALSEGGAAVGLMDADIYGPSVPIMFGVRGERPMMTSVGDKAMIVPLERYGIKLLSIGLLVDEKNAVVWRGPMVSSAVRQFITDVQWGELDYLIIDMPPGTGDIHLTLMQNPALIKNIGRNQQIKSIYPFATKYAILKTTDEMEGVLLKGLDGSYDFNNLKPFLQKGGRWPRFTDSSYSREIVISTYTATQLHLNVSDRVLIYFVRTDGSLRPDKLTIVGIYKTGIEEYDKTFAIGDLRLIRRLNNWAGDEIGGYEIFLKDYKQMALVSSAIYNDSLFPRGQEGPFFSEERPPVWETKTARELYPNIFDWLDVQDTNQFILIIIMVVVAAINLITCLIILVLERVRMIGVLKALGASNWTVQKIFLHQSGLITFTGVVIGTLFALGLLFLQLKTGFVRLKEDAYFMDTAAVEIRWWQVAVVCAGTVFISLLILLIPSLLVRKVQPIKAIHFR